MANLISADAAAPTAPRSTTGKALWVLCVSLLTTTALVGITSWLTFQKVYGTIDTVHKITAPAIFDVLAARDALVQADGAAISGFGSPAIKLTGLGQQYQDDLTSARDRLVDFAGLNTTDKGSQQIQSLEALLESYSGLTEQAYAHAETPLGTTDLWSASHLLHAGDSPILIQIKNLADDQTAILDDQIAASSTKTKNLLKWVAPIFLLFALLVVTQVFLRRRFRRAMNPWLLLATAALVGLSIVMSLAVVSQNRLEGSRDSLNEIVHLRQEWLPEADARGQRALGELIEKECAETEGGCGPTIDHFVSTQESAGTTTVEASDEQVAGLRAGFDATMTSAGENAGLYYFIPILAGLVFFVFIPFGLWPRLGEYWYRSR